MMQTDEDDACGSQGSHYEIVILVLWDVTPRQFGFKVSP